MLVLRIALFSVAAPTSCLHRSHGSPQTSTAWATSGSPRGRAAWFTLTYRQHSFPYSGCDMAHGISAVLHRDMLRSRGAAWPNLPVRRHVYRYVSWWNTAAVSMCPPAVYFQPDLTLSTSSMHGMSSSIMGYTCIESSA